MGKINMRGASVLLQKLEIKKSDFVQTDNPDPYTALHKVCFAGPESKLKYGEIAILKPGHYEHITVNGETYLYAEAEQIAGTVGGAK